VGGLMYARVQCVTRRPCTGLSTMQWRARFSYVGVGISVTCSLSFMSASASSTLLSPGGDTWVAVGVPASFGPPVGVQSPNTSYLSAGGSSIACTEGGTPTSCTLVAQVTFTNLVCGTGIGSSTGSATYVQPADDTDVDGYDVTVVLVDGIGVVEGSLVEDGLVVGPAAGVMVITPDPFNPQTCVSGSRLGDVLLSATIAGVAD